MPTAFGPQGPNYTTARPDFDPKASGGLDTWFKNCTAAGAKDGTFATADFFNVLVGNLRHLVRTAEVPLDDVLDTMIYDAVKAVVDARIAELWPLMLHADQGIKINEDTGFIQSTLGDGTRTRLV